MNETPTGDEPSPRQTQEIRIPVRDEASELVALRQTVVELAAAQRGLAAAWKVATALGAALALAGGAVVWIGRAGAATEQLRRQVVTQEDHRVAVEAILAFGIALDRNTDVIQAIASGEAVRTTDRKQLERSGEEVKRAIDTLRRRGDSGRGLRLSDD